MANTQEARESRFIAFFDECGDHSLTKIDDDFPLFLLAVVIVERDAYSNLIVPTIGKFKLKYWSHEGVNLHSREIRRQVGDFQLLHRPDVRSSFLTDLTTTVQALPFTLFLTAIRKKTYAGRYGDHAENPYTTCLEYSFERILHFLKGQGETCLPVVAEARGKNEDRELEAAFYRLMTKGTYYHKAAEFQALKCPIFFRSKRDNICGTQLADLCAYPAARSILDPLQENHAFEAVKPHIYQREKVSEFKVFPNK